MSIAIPRRARRALLAAAVPAVFAATALPASADAATVRVTGGQLQYTAAAGESNDTRVSFTGAHIHIRDDVPITVGDGCVIDDTGAALCVPGSAQARYSLGNGRDVMRYIAPHAARVDMGADDDTYFGGLREDSIGNNGLVVQDADVIGGSGADLITYRNSSNVRVSLDGQFNDGNRGKENVRPDWEHIEGSDGRDTLVGSDDAEKTEQYTARGGDDILIGNHGTDIFNEGTAPNGADDFNGGSGTDRVNYGARSSAVTVNMVDLRANDGATGEGDFVDPNVNDITGTAFADTLTGANGPNTILGLAGRDTISGLGGIDILNGGVDPDSLFGGTENDTLDTADNVADLVMNCGTGITDPDDTLNRDLRDVNATGCENVNSVGILKLAPAAISAEAGEVAKLRLSWTHPKSWKQLRSVTLRLREGEKVVGQVAIRTASGKLEDKGAVQLVRGTKLTRKGKKVSAQLALRVAPKLADSTLDADVAATDVKGAKQVSRAAASIAVSD